MIVKWYFVACFVLEVSSLAQTSRIGDKNVSTSNQNNDKFDKSCETYFENRKDSRETYGVLSIPNPNLPNSETKVILTVPVRLSTSYAGSIEVLKSNQETAQDLISDLPLQLKISYPIQNPLPQINEVHYNNKLLCKTPKADDKSNYVTTLQLTHTFDANIQKPVTRPPSQTSYLATTTPKSSNTNKQTLLVKKALNCNCKCDALVTA